MSRLLLVLCVATQLNLSRAQLDFTEAPNFLLENLIDKEVTVLENRGLVKCRIYADDVFLFICSENPNRANNTAALTEAEKKIQ